MIPMFYRRLTVGRIRVCRSPITGQWFTERLKLISGHGSWTLTSGTSESFPTFAEAIREADVLRPKKGTP